MSRKPYPSDVTDAEWEFLAPYLTLMREDAPQRAHSLRDLLNGLRYAAKIGCDWRSLPHDLPPWHAVYQQAVRWRKAGVFEAAANDLREILRLKEGKSATPSAAILDGRVLRSTPESGHRAGYSGAKRVKGSKVHLAVDTLGHLLALRVTPASTDDRAAVERSRSPDVAELAGAVQEATGQSIELAYVDQGYTGERAADAAQAEGIRLHVVKLPEAKRGFVLLPRRWVVERSFGWAARARRLARNYERLPDVLAGLHVVAFVMPMLRQATNLAAVHNNL